MKGYFRKRGKAWSFTIDLGKDAYGKRKQKTQSGFKTKKAAEAACAEVINQIEKNTYVEPTKMTFGEFILEYMNNDVKQSVRESTFNLHMLVVKKHIIPNLGHIQLPNISPLAVNKFCQQKLSEGYSSSYVKLMIVIIKKALKTAYEWELITKNVASLIKQPKVNKRKATTWTIEETNLFLQSMKGRAYYTAFLLAIFTGMRKGEICGLRWQDCDLDQGILRIRQSLYKTEGKLIFGDPKTGRSNRIITIPQSAIDFLLKHKLKQKEIKLRLGSAYQDHDLIVCYNTGNPIDPSDLNKEMKNVIQQLELPYIRFHDLRHGHATQLLAIGENIKVISERLGHSSITTTLDTYTHTLPNMQEQLANNFDQVFKSKKVIENK